MSQIDEDLKTLLPKHENPQSTMEVGLMNDLGAFLNFEGRGLAGPKKRNTGSGGPGGARTGNPVTVTPLSATGEHKGFHGDRAIGHFRFEISRNSLFENEKTYEIKFLPRVSLSDGYEELDKNSYDEVPEIIKIINNSEDVDRDILMSNPNDSLRIVTVVIETPRTLNVAVQFSMTESAK
jgi:hypothetical protein